MKSFYNMLEYIVYDFYDNYIFGKFSKHMSNEMAEDIIKDHPELLPELITHPDIFTDEIKEKYDYIFKNELF